MEIDIVNDILTLTVNRYILGQTVELPRNVIKESGPTRGGSVTSDHGSRLTQSSLVSRKDDSFDSIGDKFSEFSRDQSINIKKPEASRPSSSQLLKGCTIPEWLKHNAPILMHESLRKLGLELDKIEKMPLNNFSEDQLGERKKAAKNELKYYDISFEKEFKRAPNRDEKEPMRPLYIYYKLLKQAMDHPVQPQKKNATDALLEELVELKNQRNELRSKLEAYQYDFMRRNNRRIKYRADIRDVEADYNLYKRLKEDIKKLEDTIRDKMGH